MNRTINKLGYLFINVLLIAHTTFAQPVNDNACDAISIILDTPAISMDMDGATTETGEENLVPPSSLNCQLETWCDKSGPNGTAGIDQSIWFKVTIPPTRAIEIRLCGSDFDTQMALYRVGDCADFSTFELITANDNTMNCGANGRSSSIFKSCLEAGEDYYILVDAWIDPSQPAPASGRAVITGTTQTVLPTDVAISDDVLLKNPQCPGGDDGSIDISIIVGQYPFIYNWSNGANSEDLSGLTPGMYTVTVTDFCQTTTIKTYEVKETLEPEAITFREDAHAVIHPTHCGGCAKGGQVSALLSSGASPFSYLWSTGDTTPVISNLSDGEYTLTVTDYCGLLSAEKTFYVGMEAGPDLTCLDEINGGVFLGLDHSQTGGNATGITYNVDQTLGPNLACRSTPEGFIGPNSWWLAYDFNGDFGFSNEEIRLHTIEVFPLSIPNVAVAPGVPVTFWLYIASTKQLDDPGLQLIPLDSVHTYVPLISDYASYQIPFRKLDFPFFTGDLMVLRVQVKADFEDGHFFDLAANATTTPQTTYISSPLCGPARPSPVNVNTVSNICYLDGFGLFYEWSPIGSDPSPNDPTPFTSNSGTYMVTITDIACGLTRVDTVSYDDTPEVFCISKIDDPIQSQFSFYPNPGNGLFQIITDRPIQNTQLNLFDFCGQLVHSQAPSSTNLDLSSLPKGIYLAKVTQGDKVEVHKLVIQ